MFFSFVVALMVILIAAFWTYQGFFSSLLMFFESVIACMVAFGFYEPVGGLVSESLGLGLALPLGFAALFFGTLGLLRAATDKLIHDNVSLPLALDRAGAAIAGLFSGMIIIGSALTAIQMLPIGSEIFGFERIAVDSTKGEYKTKSLGLMFRPDEFACGLATLLSNGRFGNEGNSLAEQKPDIIMSLYSARSVPMSEENMFIGEGTVKVTRMWQAAQIDHATHTKEGDKLSRAFEAKGPDKSINTFLVCHVQIARNASGKDAKDEIRFRVPQFRLVGPAPKENVPTSERPRVYLAVGLSDIYTHQHAGPKEVVNAQRDRLVAFSPTTDFVLGPNETKVLEKGDNYEFDVAFEVPVSVIDQKPWYLEFKHGGRADLSKIKIEKEAPDNASHSQGTGGMSGKVKPSQGEIVGDAPGGTTHGFNAINDRTGVTDELPIVLDKTAAAVSGHLFQGKVGGDECRFWVNLGNEEISEENQVTRFAVPDDKRMVQIGADILKQNFFLSRALGFASRIVGQVKVTDENGKDYYAIGFYVALEENGQTTFEVQYDPTSEVPERALKQPNKLKHSQLANAPKDKVKFGFLFVVDPGVKIVKFHADQKTSQDMANPIEVPN